MTSAADHLYDTIAPYADMLPLASEYDRISEQFLKNLKNKNSCVSAIFKIRNTHLEERMNARVAAITEKRGAVPEIITVYHGTTLAAAASIASTGFDPRYSTTAAFGKGTYASPSPSMAMGYCKDVRSTDNFCMIFMCRFVKGKRGDTGGGSIINTELMDYCGNGKDIYVTPYAEGIIPDYLIAYYKWAT